MKKLVVTAITLFAFIINTQAQDISSHALGIRIGDNDGFGVEISYQKSISSNNRLEFDLGFRDNKNYDAWKLSGIYQWVWNIDGNFNWYAGFGAGIGSLDISNDRFDGDDGLFINANGNIGVEYDFDIPLLISIDFRPELGLINNFGDNDLGLDIALGLRYQF